MRTHLLGGIAVLLLASPAAAGPGAAPIIGGSPTSVGDYPTVVAVLTGGGLCTGTLIAPEWVVTAAHCLEPAELGLSTQEQVTQRTTVVFDSIDINRSGGREIGAAFTLPHPAFALGNHDIGVIRLASPITDRTPTPLNRFAEQAPVGIGVTMVGYGVTGSGSAGKEYMVTGRFSISCAGLGESDAALLCFSQQDGAGQCNGDSGGPAFAMIGGVPTLVGITSFGDQGCQQMGANTRVDHEMDFVDEQLGPEFECAADGLCAAQCGHQGLPQDADCPLCVGDGDCTGDDVCDTGTGVCGPGPFSPGGLGGSCVNGNDCESGACATGHGQTLCTTSCELGGDTCPDAFDCVAAGADALCWPTPADTGICSSAPPANLGLVGLVLCGLLLVRRRRA